MKLTLFISLFLITSTYAQQTCTAEFFFDTEQSTPWGLETDGQNFWVSGTGSSNLLTIHDELGNYIETLYPDGNSGLRGAALELQEDTLWVAEEQSASLYKLNKWTGETYAIFDLPTLGNGDPNNFGLAFDGTSLWNMEYRVLQSQSVLFKISPSNGEPLDTLILDAESLLPIEIIANKMLAIEWDLHELYEVDLATGELTYLMDWCLVMPYDIAFHPDNGLFGISGPNGTTSVNKILGLDLPTNVFIPNSDTFTVDIMPNPTSEMLRVYCENIENGTIMIFDALGKLCLTDRISNNTFEKNISGFSSGMYYLHINGDKKSAVKKFVKAE